MIGSQPDFFKIIGRFHVDPRLLGYIVVSKIYFFSAFHLASTYGEPEIFTASKPFAIFSKHYFFADSADSRV